MTPFNPCLTTLPRCREEGPHRRAFFYFQIGYVKHIYLESSTRFIFRDGNTSKPLLSKFYPKKKRHLRESKVVSKYSPWGTAEVMSKPLTNFMNFNRRKKKKKKRNWPQLTSRLSTPWHSMKENWPLLKLLYVCWKPSP